MVSRLLYRSPAGWQFFSVARATFYGELRFSRMYRWDDSRANDVLLGDGDVLQPGVGYFGHRAQAGGLPQATSEAKHSAGAVPRNKIIEEAAPS